MVVFFVHRYAADTFTDFLTSWGACLGNRVGLAYYESVGDAGSIVGAGTYVFTDLERLTTAGLERATTLADSLLGSEQKPRVLNHPRGAFRRYEVLNSLHEIGVNPFRAYRVLEMRSPARFPVFLRREDNHLGPLTPLLRSQGELDRAVANQFLIGHDLSKVLIVEFEDVSNGGTLFHRQITYVIGDELINGNLAFDTSWVVKYGGAHDAPEEMAQWLARESMNHLPLLRKLAARCGIEYGRFDYSIVDDGIRAWELNTNPTLLLHADKYPPEVRTERRKLADRLTGALAQLAASDTGNVASGVIALPAFEQPSDPAPPRRILGPRSRAVRRRVARTVFGSLPAGAARSLAQWLNHRVPRQS